MENNVLVHGALDGDEPEDPSGHGVVSPAVRKTCVPPPMLPHHDVSPPMPPQLLPNAAVTLIRELIDDHQLTKEQLLKIYDDHINSKLQEQDSLDSMDDHSQSMLDEEENCPVVYRDTPPPLTSVVTTTMTTIEELSSEIGQKRKHFTLEDELNTVQMSPFVECLLDRDQSVVAHVIKRYMSQYSIPQREVVEITNLNQSHLSQHFLHGVTMKRAKRVKLYQWFEDDQKTRTGKVQSADGNLTAVLESPRVEGKRRPRWKWSPISTQILTEAFKRNQFPTRDQRLDLARICNEAEVAMNNGAKVRGPEGDTEGITEQRVNTWFTNRRKGLGTPISPPPPNKVFNGLSTPLYPPLLHPTILQGASPATTPVMTRGRVEFLGGSPSSDRVTTPTTLQSLVSQIQESQVGQQKATSLIPSLLSRPPLALPLALSLPQVASPTTLMATPPHTHVMATPPPLGSHASTPSPATHPPFHTVAMPFSLGPLISPSQVQALISQFHSPLSTATTSHDSPSHSYSVPGIPLTVQSVTIASDPTILVSPSSQEEGSRLTQLSGGIVLSPGQLQALVRQVQTQQAQRDGLQIVALPYSATGP